MFGMTGGVVVRKFTTLTLTTYHITGFWVLLVGGGVNGLDEVGAFPVLDHRAGAVVVVVFAFLLCLLECEALGQTVEDVVVLAEEG